MTSPIDTPDWQFGVVSPQQLLANSSSSPVTITLPANVESLLIRAEFSSAPADPLVIGVTSGLRFPVFSYNNNGFANPQFYAVPMLPPSDSQVTISWTTSPVPSWQAIGDSGVRVIADATLSSIIGVTMASSATLGGLQTFGHDSLNLLRGFLTSEEGVQFVTPSPPGTFSGDHPPTERSFAVAARVGGTTTIVAAPGAGKRIRLYEVGVQTEPGSSAAIIVNDTVSNFSMECNAGQAFTHNFHDAGVPCNTNKLVQVQLLAGTGIFSGSVLYTVETV